MKAVLGKPAYIPGLADRPLVTIEIDARPFKAGGMPNWNNYLDCLSARRAWGDKMRRDWRNRIVLKFQEAIQAQLGGQAPLLVKSRFVVRTIWDTEQGKGRDTANFWDKIVLDAAQEADLLWNDRGAEINKEEAEGWDPVNPRYIVEVWAKSCTLPEKLPELMAQKAADRKKKEEASQLRAFRALERKKAAAAAKAKAEVTEEEEEISEKKKVKGTKNGTSRSRKGGTIPAAPAWKPPLASQARSNWESLRAAGQ